MANGINTEQRKMMDFAKIASKMKSKRNQELKLTNIETLFMIAKLMDVQKV